MKLNPVDIKQMASASTIVFDALRKAIIEGDIADGEALRQDEIARLFNTSRIPVREAILRLEQQGLVKSIRYKGAVVASLSIEEADEIFDFRSLIEADAIRQAVPLMSKELLQEAREYCEDFARAPDPMDWGDLNRKFHSTLYAACKRSFHLSVIDNAMDRVDRFLRAQLIMTNGMTRANKEHLAILHACEKGDAELAAELTRRHILDAKASFVEHMKSANADKE